MSQASSPKKVLAFAGSARNGSLNHALLQHVVALAAEATPELSLTLISLADFPMPLFNEDLEAADGNPPAAIALKELMASHQGLLIASPEYNSLPTPLLLNTISWLSRKTSATEAPLAAFTGKIAGVLATSPGATGGLRGVPILRHCLQNIGVTVVPQLVCVSAGHTHLATPATATSLPQPYRGMALTLLKQLSQLLG